MLSTWKENIYINIITDSEERESYFPKSPEIRSRKIPLKLLKQISDASVCVCAYTCVSICTVWIQPAKSAFDPKNNFINDF